LDDETKPPSPNCWYVFKKYKSWVDFCDKPVQLPIKAASLSIQARSKSSRAEVLARKASVYDIRFSREIPRHKVMDVGGNGGKGKLTFGHSAKKYSLNVSVEFTVSEWFDPISEGDCESPNPGKQIQPI
jgi:hypothetical protein